jgi:hypothetical protein
VGELEGAGEGLREKEQYNTIGGGGVTNKGNCKRKYIYLITRHIGRGRGTHTNLWAYSRTKISDITK